MATEDRIDGYAAAILEIAAAEGALERVGDELFRIARVFESSPELREAITNPRLPVERKLGIVEDLLGARVSTLALGFVGFVVGVGRGGDLPAIADALAARTAASHGRVLAEVRTAVELDDATVARLADSLGRAIGRQVEVKTVVDPTVIGGIVARVGDTVIDGSVRNRFDEIRQQLTRQ